MDTEKDGNMLRRDNYTPTIACVPLLRSQFSGTLISKRWGKLGSESLRGRTAADLPWLSSIRIGQRPTSS
jgi:hypothetical protein